MVEFYHGPAGAARTLVHRTQRGLIGMDGLRGIFGRYWSLQEPLIRRAAELQHLGFKMADVSALAEQPLLPFLVLRRQEIDLPVTHGFVDLERADLCVQTPQILV